MKHDTRLRGHRRKALPTLLVLALGLVLFALVGSAAALDVLDQEQASGGGGYLQFNDASPAAQTFTAGGTGPLGKISVYTGGWRAYTVRAEIWSTTGVAPYSRLAGTQVSVPNASSHWVDITFASPPTLTAGSRYAIVLWKVDHDFVWHFAGSDVYTAGAAYTGIQSGGGWYWSTFGSRDFAFKTYRYVADHTPPVVNAPADITAEATTAAGATVTFSASAIDDVDGAMPASAIHYYTGYGTVDQAEIHSGGLFAIGTTTVTVAAIDASGNTGIATFNVSVVDTTSPTVVPPGNLTIEAVSSAGAEVSFGASSANDIVDGSMLASSIHYYTGYGTEDLAEVYSGDTFSLGTTTVTVAATDSHGNTGTATFTISVIDTTAPVLTVPADMTVEATGPVGAPVSYSVSAVDLVDGVVTPRVVPASGITFPIGETTVWVSAKDGAGNISTGSFVVTVLSPNEMLDKLARAIMNAPDDPTAPGGIAPVIEESLLAKVNAALAALNRGNKNDAKVVMNDLKALTNEVQAQTAKAISPEAAEAIIAAANRLVDVLSAPATSLPVTKGAFVGLDQWGAEWQVQMNTLGSGAVLYTPYYDLGAGTISFTSWQALPDGTRVEKSFTMTVDRFHSHDYFPAPEGDAGAATGISGPVVTSTGGEGVPSVGDFYLFLAWDGAQGYTNPDGTVGHYPDTWKFVPWPDTASYARNFQRTTLGVWLSHGTQHYYPSTTPGTSGTFQPLWPVTEGDIDIQGGWIN